MSAALGIANEALRAGNEADKSGSKSGENTIALRMTIAANLSAIHERIKRAGQRSGRSADDVALMAVSKNFPAERIVEAYQAGQRLFGENRVQEFADKVAALTALRGCEFHMIGHLQSNKAARAAEIFHAVDSIDSAKLAERLNAATAEARQDARRPDRDQCRR